MKIAEMVGHFFSFIHSGYYNLPFSICFLYSLIIADEVKPLDESMPIENLKSMLQYQLEYYFSRENLAKDTYLLSQMDSDQYVLISTVASFDQIRRLTRNMDLIVSVLKGKHV